MTGDMGPPLQTSQMLDFSLSITSALSLLSFSQAAQTIIGLYTTPNPTFQDLATVNRTSYGAVNVRPEGSDKILRHSSVESIGDSHVNRGLQYYGYQRIGNQSDFFRACFDTGSAGE